MWILTGFLLFSHRSTDTTTIRSGEVFDFMVLRELKYQNLIRFLVTYPILATGLAHGQSLKREMNSAELLGSGQAGATETSGIDALFYNPANLGRTETIIGDVVIVSPHIEASQNGLNIYRDVQANKGMLDIIGSALGKPVSVGIQNATGASFRRTAFALFQRADLDVAVKSNAMTGIPEASASSIARMGAAFGLGRSVIGRSVYLGATGIIMQKAEAKLSVSALDAQSQIGDSGGESLLNDALKRGVAVGAHLSLQISPEDKSYPDFFIAARNIGMVYSVGGKSPNDRPTAELQTIDAGLSFKPGTKNSTSRLSIDVRDILNKSKENIYKRLHLGAELNFSNVVGVLGGVNQGYTTYGIFLNSKIARLDAGIFAEELGVYPGDIKNRSYYARITVGWTK